MVQVTNAPGFMVGAVTVMASLEPLGLAGRIIHQFFWTQRRSPTRRVRLQFRVWISPSEGAPVPRQVGLACLWRASGRAFQSVPAGWLRSGRDKDESSLFVLPRLGSMTTTPSALAPNLTSPTNLDSRRRTGRFRIPTTSATATFTRCSARPGYGKIRLHDPRHSFGSLLIQ